MEAHWSKSSQYQTDLSHSKLSSCLKHKSNPWRITSHESRFVRDIDKQSATAHNDKQWHHLSPIMPLGSGIRHVMCATIMHLWASNAELLSRVGPDRMLHCIWYMVWNEPKWSASPTTTKLIGDIPSHLSPKHFHSSFFSAALCFSIHISHRDFKKSSLKSCKP